MLTPKTELLPLHKCFTRCDEACTDHHDLSWRRVPPPLVAAGVPGAGASTPVAKLRGFSCQRSVNPVGRGIAVSAVMRPLKGTRRLSLRFELLMRTKTGGPWTSVPGG